MADVVVNKDNTNPKELLGQGIKAYILQDYTSAVAALSKASELLVVQHGDDLHDSIADVYLYYGKALLGLSREETGALGDAIQEKDESDDETEGEDTETEEADEGGKKEAADANDTTEHNEEKENDKNDAVEAESNGTTKESEPSGSGIVDGTEDKVEGEEEPTDLQVAWEVLELAKKIFEKRGDAGKKHLAETLIILGEVSLESENFDSAVNDIKEGLKIQKELFPDDSRTVAETHYKLGVAYSTISQIDEAVQSFEESLQYLANRISNLEKLEDKKDEIEEEIKELKGLIPDIEEKIADMKSYKDETLKQILSSVAECKPTAASSSSSTVSEVSSSKPASNISHLVKRKRKLDEILEETEKEAEESPSKKTTS